MDEDKQKLLVAHTERLILALPKEDPKNDWLTGGDSALEITVNALQALLDLVADLQDADAVILTIEKLADRAANADAREAGETS
jgi:hypothetical protein